MPDGATTEAAAKPSLPPTLDRRVWTIAAVVALVPVGRMLWWVHHGSVVQYTDYWRIAKSTFLPSGGLRLGALAELQGQHLLTVPQLVYWANMRLFGGSNITLGYVVVAVAVGQVLVLWTWIARGPRIPALLQGALAVATAALLFAPHGAWNFLLSMSGTAWLVANLITLAALSAMALDRPWIAVGLAVVATLTYGTGLACWPALLVIAVLRGRWRRSVLPTLAVGAPVLAGYAMLRTTSTLIGPPGPDPLAMVSNTAVVVGGLFMRDPGSARLLGGAAILTLLAVGGWVGWTRATRASVPWLGLGTYALVAAALIGYSRHLPGDGANLLGSRYSSIAALTWIALLGLVVQAGGPRPRRWVTLVGAAGLAALSLWAAFGDGGNVRQLQRTQGNQHQLADALRIGVAEGGPWLVFEPFPELTPLLSSLGHHPFDGRDPNGCGLRGTTLGPDEVAPLDGVEVGGPSVAPSAGMPSAVGLRAWVAGADDRIECATVADGDGTVVGIGRIGGLAPPRHPDAQVIQALAPSDSESYQVLLRFQGSDQVYGLPPTPAPS